MDYEFFKKSIEKTIYEVLKGISYDNKSREYDLAISSDQSEQDIETIEYKNVEQESINPGLLLTMMGLALS